MLDSCTEQKRIAGEDAVTSVGVLKFLDYPNLTQEVVINVDDISG